MDKATVIPENLTEKLKRWFVATRDAIGEAKLLAGLDDETVKMIAQDCAVSEQDLRDLIRKGPHAGDEMLALMQRLGIDAEEARLEGPAEFRDMHMTCARCGEKSRCRKDIAEGNAETEFRSYCGNADQLAGMQQDPQLRTK